MKTEDIAGKLEKLKKKKNAVILAHNYQRAEIQDIADFVGDSLGLSQSASRTDADIILFCGVDFMAQTASILNPDKKVLIPDIASICPMAQMLHPDTLLEAIKKNPDAEVMLYINTLAETKVYADCICTSANAPEMVNSMDTETVLFGPDKNLAYFVQQKTAKKVISVPKNGICPTHHHLITMDDLQIAKKKHPDAKIIVHPECIPEIQKKAQHIASTEGILRYCKASSDTEFLIGTEVGILHRLKKEISGKKFYPISERTICSEMKLHTLEKALAALDNERPVVRVEKKIADRARKPIERMLKVSEKLGK